MKRMINENNNNGFYYLAGLSVGHYYGGTPMEFRIKVVNRFKEWVNDKAGSDPLPTNHTTISQIVQKFIFEFERYKRKEFRGKQRN